MKLLNPEAFLLLIPLLAALIYLGRVVVRKRSRIIYPTGEWVNKRPPNRWLTPFKIYSILRPLALIMFIIALARPQNVFQNEKRKVEAVDIIICFDLSKSMDALDFDPNRRTVALKTISSFISTRKDDRIGLVLFSGESYLAVPITHDHKHLVKILNDSTNKYLKDGTAIGQSLAVAVNHLKDSKAKSRVVILLTDGDNNMGSVSPITAAELAKSYGVKIYSVAIGKKGRVAYPIKTKDQFGNVHVVYNYLTDAVNEELLTSISTRTNAKFFRATESNVLDDIFKTIDKLEKTEVETNTVVRYSEASWLWILLGLIFLCLEGFALNTRWRKIP